MSLVDPKLTRRIAVVLLALLACCLGWQLAQGSYFFAALVGAGVLLWLCGWLTRLEVGAFLCGLAAVGYLVGNRGFAQLSLPFLPLFPGELVLAAALAVAVLRSAQTKTLPFRPDALNWILLLWLLCGGARLFFNVRSFGFEALRDFAMVYYALFFFLAQSWAAQDFPRRWLCGCLRVGFFLCAPVYVLFLLWPDWFLYQLTVAGNPLVYIKADVAAGMMIAAAFLAVERYWRSRRWGWLAVAAFSLAAALASSNRAAVAGLLVALFWLLLFFRTGLLRIFALLGAAGFAGLLALALVQPKPFERSLVYRFYEMGASMLDAGGTRSYRLESLEAKPDNNRFRTTWWKQVIGETWAENRWFGKGFGYDLSDNFQKIYYPEGSSEFAARSPHNFLITVFGRQGLLGLALLLVFLAALGVETWKTGNKALASREGTSRLVWWLCGWIIFTTACFGVVLEGPMGAIPFWLVLGLANGLSNQSMLEPSPAPAEDTRRSMPPAP